MFKIDRLAGFLYWFHKTRQSHSVWIRDNFPHLLLDLNEPFSHFVVELGLIFLYLDFHLSSNWPIFRQLKQKNCRRSTAEFIELTVKFCSNDDWLETILSSIRIGLASLFQEAFIAFLKFVQWSGLGVMWSYWLS